MIWLDKQHESTRNINVLKTRQNKLKPYPYFRVYTIHVCVVWLPVCFQVTVWYLQECHDSGRLMQYVYPLHIHISIMYEIFGSPIFKLAAMIWFRNDAPGWLSKEWSPWGRLHPMCTGVCPHRMTFLDVVPSALRRHKGRQQCHIQSNQLHVEKLASPKIEVVLCAATHYINIWIFIYWHILHEDFLGWSCVYFDLIVTEVCP